MLLKKPLPIKPSKEPITGQPLSGVVWVTDTKGRGTCSIKFPEQVVDTLAKALPYGLGPAMPGFLKLIQKPLFFEVWFSYLEVSESFLLWRETEKPTWCRRVSRTVLS